ncbi:MAG: hypothetical protein QXQ40_02545 [Candidatus Aenigmatarchaeota archaeon]
MLIEGAIAMHSGDPILIEDTDIQWAIQLWISGEEVPGTDGQMIARYKSSSSYGFQAS